MTIKQAFALYAMALAVVCVVLVGNPTERAAQRAAYCSYEGTQC